MSTTTFPRETLMHVVKSMPAAPQILSRLGHMKLDPNVDLPDVTALLRCDAALTARIIRVANSPTYCVGEPYASLEQALARVGFGEIYTIAGFAAIAQMASHDLSIYGVSGAHVRENSLLTALIVEALAERAGIDPQEAYSAGLLRSTGKIALEGLANASGFRGPGGKPAPSLSGFKAKYDPASEQPIVAWENANFGLSNCETASFILHEWRFPAGIVEAIGNHYSPIGVSEEPVLSALLNLAAGAADKMGYPLPGEQGYWELSEEKWAAAGVDESLLESATTRALERFKSLQSAVG